MASGANVSEDIKPAYEKMKMGKSHRFITFKFEDDTYKNIIIDQMAPRSATYGDFVSALRDSGTGKAQCRYGLMDYEYKTPSGNPKSKIIFVTWVPDTGSIKDKMLFASSKSALKRQFDSIGKDIHAADVADLDETEILTTCSKTDRN